MDAFKHPPPKKKPSKSPVSNLEFVEEFYTIEENESDEQDAHFFENAVIFDNITEGMKKNFILIIDYTIHYLMNYNSCKKRCNN
jgi:hypothetical protein